MRIGTGAWVLVWLAGCDPADALPAPPMTTSGESSGGAETTGGSGTSTSGSEGASDGEALMPDLPSVCSEFLDEAGRDTEIRITNASASDVYLFDVDGCSSIEAVWQIATEDGGLWPTSCGLGSACETLLGHSCTSPWCTLACYDRGGIRLLPGATYVDSFEGLARLPTTLTPECADGCDDQACLQARSLLDQEPVNVNLRVSASPTCAMGTSCACEPGAEGWCDTLPAALDAQIDEVVLGGSVENGIVDVTFAP